MTIKEALEYVRELLDYEGAPIQLSEAYGVIREELERVSTTTGPNGPYGSPTRAHEIALSGSVEATALNPSQHKICPECRGSGCVPTPDPPETSKCMRCDGTGKL